MSDVLQPGQTMDGRWSCWARCYDCKHACGVHILEAWSCACGAVSYDNAAVARWQADELFAVAPVFLGWYYDVQCPVCPADIGEACVDEYGVADEWLNHRPRIAAADAHRNGQISRELDAWLWEVHRHA